MQLLPLEIRNRVSFFERLEKDVEKASVGSELRILYEKFGNYCAKLEIIHAFGNITLSNDACDKECLFVKKGCADYKFISFD